MSTKLRFVTGDLFNAPANSILVHACNTQGAWGGGIATTFKEKFPQAFRKYKEHCQEHGDDLLGSCFILPADEGGEDTRQIACLFTSRKYGKFKDSKLAILDATKLAIKELLSQNKGERELHACRFNSGKFGVPWDETQKVLDELEVKMTVYEPLVPNP